MDIPDRSEGFLSPWPAGGGQLPATVAPKEPETEARAALDFRLITRAFRRHWWQILLVWIVASAAAGALIWRFVPPTYRATAWLQVESSPRSPILPTPTVENSRDFEAMMETQVLLITSPDVLTAALEDRKVKVLPSVRRSPDPETDLREALEVEAQKGTHVILVSMATETPSEGALLVNAVVNSYLRVATTWTTNEGRVQITKLQETEKKFQRDMEQKKAILEALLKKKGGDTQMIQSRDQIALNQFQQYAGRLVEVKTKRIQTEAIKKILEEEARAQGLPTVASTAPRRVDPAELRPRVEAAFYRQSDVAAVVSDYHHIEEQLAQAHRLARRGNEPTVKRLREHLAALKAQHDTLWEKYRPELEKSLATIDPEPVDPIAQQRAEDLRRARLEVSQLQAEEDDLQARVDEAAEVTKQAGNEAVDIEFAGRDLDFAQKLVEGVKQALHQAEYEASNGTRVSLISLAKPTSSPEKMTGLKLMLVAPLAILGGLWGLALLLEIRAGRVADPDDLPTRVRVGVLGVVPPLPPSRLAGGRNPKALRDDRRRVEEFVQSLDHLRVSLCAPAPGAAGRRCLLITSAVGGEGKTTLAAQLAGRCAHAGLLTLLIDADLRRPSLGDLLEVPEGPGLADLLAGEATPESAMVVIGNAGGFHLLPAGNLAGEPGRLLHGERLGTLLAQFRATFDVVIVDAPPVLAVPDALLLGRWTDGAVLAVRHDTSRFPLVERANRRLSSVGIAVLGAVVNGVRTMESNYGAYHYDPYAGRGADTTS